MKAAKKMLKQLVARVFVPETGDRLAEELCGEEGPLIEKAFIGSVSEYPVSVLVGFLQFLERFRQKNSLMVNVIDTIVRFLDSIDRELIRGLDFHDSMYLCVHPALKKVHLLLREVKQRESLNFTQARGVFLYAKNADIERRQSLLEHFRCAFAGFVAGLKYSDFRCLLREKIYTEEYLPIVLSHAEVLLMDPEFSLAKLKHMEENYESNPDCKMAVLLPVVKKCYAIRNVSELTEAQSLAEFLLSPYLIEDSLESSFVWEHFLVLLKAENDPTEIEKVFEKKASVEIPDNILDSVCSRYIAILSDDIRSHKEDLAWLWKRLWGCPFNGGLHILDKYIRETLRKTNPEVAWQIACSCSGYKEIEPYKELARRKYIGWFTPRISKEEDVRILNRWIAIGKKKTEENVLTRVRQLWTPLSFGGLRVVFADKIGLFDERIRQLKKEMLREKLAQFLETVHLPDELIAMYGDLRPLQQEDDYRFEKAFGRAFEVISSQDLIAFEKKNLQVPYHFHGYIERCLRAPVKACIEDKNLGPMELVAHAKTLPSILGHLAGYLFEEAKARIMTIADISQIEELFRERCTLRDAMEERYLALLPDALLNSSEEELDLRHQRCPPKLYGKFIEQLIAIAG
ncbi:MAG: hypothetical protein NTY33_02075 [Candidatus Moranbacteria bacterium]|nr:hypothetical protein [Candidatus Moranbacteria bacterium]